MKPSQPWFVDVQNAPWKTLSDCFTSVLNTTFFATELAVASQRSVAQQLAQMGQPGSPGGSEPQRSSRAKQPGAGNPPSLDQQMLKLLRSPWDLATAMVAVNSLETAADISHAQQHCCDAVLRSQRVVLDFWSSAARAAEGPLRHYQPPAKRPRPAKSPLH